jgi:chromosome segregation ATPase
VALDVGLGAQAATSLTSEFGRDVVIIQEELIKHKAKGKTYKPSHAVEALPSVDLTECLKLFGPSECTLTVKPRSCCGGFMEITHMETDKVRQLQEQVSKLKEQNKELTYQVSFLQKDLTKSRGVVQEEKQLRLENQGYFIKEIEKLKARIAEDDAPGLRAKLKNFQKTQTELLEAKERLKELDKTLQNLEVAKEQIGKLKETIVGLKEELAAKVEEVHQLETDNAAVKKALDKAEKDKVKLNGTITKLEKDLDKTEQELLEAQEAVKRKEEALEKAKQAELAVRTRLMEAEKEFQETLEEKDKEMEAMEKKMDEMRDAEAEFKQKIAKLEKKVKEQENAMEAVRLEYEKKMADAAALAKAEREKKKADRKSKKAVEEEIMPMEEFVFEEVVVEEAPVLIEEATAAAPAPEQAMQGAQADDGPQVNLDDYVAKNVYDGVKVELANLNIKCKELVARMQQMHAKYRSLQEENEGLEESLAGAEETLASTQTELENERGRNKAMADTMAELESKIAMLEDEKSVLMRRAANAGASSEELQAQIDEQTKKWKKAERELHAIQKEVNLSRKLRAGLETVISGLCVVMKNWRACEVGEADDYMKAVLAAEKDPEAAVMNLQVWKRAAEEAEAAFFENLEAQRKKMQDGDNAVADAQQAMADAQAKFDKCEKRLNQSLVECSNLKEEKAILEGKLKAMEKAKKDADVNWNKKCNKLDQDMNRLEEKFDKLKLKEKSLQATLMSTTMEKQGYQKQIGILTKTLDAAEKDRDTFETELVDLRAKYKDTCAQLAAMTEKYDSTLAWANKAQAELDKLVAKESQRLATNTDFQCQVMIVPEKCDVGLQAAFVAPAFTLRQHNVSKCHPAYFKNNASVVVARQPQTGSKFPAPNFSTESLYGDPVHSHSQPLPVVGSMYARPATADGWTRPDVGSMASVDDYSDPMQVTGRQPPLAPISRKTDSWT